MIWPICADMYDVMKACAEAMSALAAETLVGPPRNELMRLLKLPRLDVTLPSELRYMLPAAEI